MASIVRSHTYLPNCIRLTFCLLFILSLTVIGHAQTTTYHLHRDSNVFLLKTAGPDTASVAVQSANLKNQPVGEYLIKAFDTQSGVPGVSGVIPAGSIVTFSLWMKRTGNQGTMFPRAKLNLNSATGTSLCVVTGTTALNTTLTKYTLTGTVSSNVTMTATDRFYLWVGVNLTASPSTNSVGRLDIEGTLNGNFDSQITVRLPVVAPPSITNVSPNSGPVGTPVTITGTNFGATQGTSTVTFNGTAATPTSWSATSIAVPVSAGATTGPVVVTVNGQASNGVTFTVTPKINSLNPTSGLVGISVTISGTTFGATQGTSTVTFNGTPATPTSWSATSITAPVPADATTGPVVVTVNGQASNGVTFTVTPKIDTLTPNAGLAGTNVTINGSGFGAIQGTSTVTFNGTTATPTSWNSTTIVVPVPTGATTGNVVVTVQGVASNGVNFIVSAPPTAAITSPSDGATFNVPAFITITATASDPDGTVTKVEFYVANTKIGEDTTAPYSFLWKNAPAGSHSLSVAAIDNAGATTRSSAIAITVNAIPVLPQGAPCPSQPSTTSFQFEPHQVGDRNVTMINLAPCETIAVTESHTLTSGNVGTNVKVAYYNNQGQVLHQQTYWGFFTATNQFPMWTPEPFPWRGVRSPEALPAYLYIESVDVLGGAPVYNFAISREPRRDYNIGGTSLANAPVVPYFPYTYYGSLRFEEIDGQYYKFRLEPGQSVRATGLAEGNLNYGAIFRLDIYDAAGNLITTQSGGWRSITAYGSQFYTTDFFANPNPTATDFYVRARTTLWPIYDFELNLEIEACPVPSESDPNTPDATGTGPLSTTSAEYQFPAAIDTDILPDREVELWARVYRPSNLSGGPYPLAVFLHGNHDTCGTGSNPRTDDDSGYTLTGMCGFVPFVTNGSGSLRNDSNGWFGMKVTTGVKPIVIKSLGRIFNYANSGSHTIKVVRISDNSAVASVVVSMAGGTENTFKYQSLITPVTLTANTSYYIVSQEFQGGDSWYDSNGLVQARSVATINAAVSRSDGVSGWNVGTTPERSYGLLNFQYDLVAPDNYVVVPNHRGYDYLADKLASHGYIVVSINANRGITGGPGVTGDTGLIMARGRLVLRHLQRLSEWNTNGGTPASLGVSLQGKLDFTNVGLMGHSRGGEGVRAAHSIFMTPGSESTMWHGLIPNLNRFKGVFEIAPTDVRRDEVGTGLQADGTSWNVLLPICDGDLATLPGVRPFDRMLGLSSETSTTQKSTYTVWGANHNYYSTEWQIPENQTTCIGRANVQLWTSGTSGSSTQRQTGLASVLAFFRGNVGAAADPNFNKNFNPRNGLPYVVTSVTKVDRGFMPSPDAVFNLVADDFTQAFGTDLCAAGSGDDCSGVSVMVDSVDNHDAGLHAGFVDWLSSGPNTYYQNNWAPAGGGLDVSSFQNLDFRVSRQLNVVDHNPQGRTTFSIQLVLANGLSNAVSLCKYTDLRGPVGGMRCAPQQGGGCITETNYHPILQTVRIPLADFGTVDLTKVRGVRFSFNNTSSGSINLANIRFTKGQ